jgi:hypothetical protein
MITPDPIPTTEVAHMGRSDRLHAGLDSWVILNGDLPEMAVGEEIQIRLVALLLRILLAPEGAPPVLEHVGLSYYRFRLPLQRAATGAVILRLPPWDAPVLVESAPDSLEGRLVEGEMELLVHAPGDPAHQLHVVAHLDSITRETANWRDRRREENRPVQPGRRLLTMERLFRSHGLRHVGMPVFATDVHHHDGGLSHYILELDIRIGG